MEGVGWDWTRKRAAHLHIPLQLLQEHFLLLLTDVHFLVLVEKVHVLQCRQLFNLDRNTEVLGLDPMSGDPASIQGSLHLRGFEASSSPAVALCLDPHSQLYLRLHPLLSP